MCYRSTTVTESSTPPELHREALDALGDANRRAILELLTGGGRSVRAIADELPISRPAVSRHLRVLKGAGLVGDHADGARRIYGLRDDGIQAVRAYFAEVWDQAAGRSRLVAETDRPGGGGG